MGCLAALIFVLVLFRTVMSTMVVKTIEWSGSLRFGEFYLEYDGE